MRRGLHSYGLDAAAVLQLPGADQWLAEGLSEAMVRFAARHEYARTVEDMLARRSRLLFLDARLAGPAGPARGGHPAGRTGARSAAGGLPSPGAAVPAPARLTVFLVGA
ncbi:glycerol-3-phosphate dehydrogenase [Alicycliphilus sp. B1]|nr:glycerol-3-phosphate dehydrogenase [Alicycliphilus sp. B1]